MSLTHSKYIFLLQISGIHLEVSPLTEEELLGKASGESSEEIRSRVEGARKIQRERFDSGVDTNSTMAPQQLQEFCNTDIGASNLLKTAINDLNLSARAYDRILRLARTIADLEKEENILTHHVAEAIQYRTLDRKLW